MQGHKQETHGGARVHGASVLAPHCPARDVRGRVDLLSWSSTPRGRQNIAANSLASVIQVRNEIAVLKKISKGHTNIVTLHDYFEVCCQCLLLDISQSVHRLHITSTSSLICVLVASSSIVYVPRGTTTKSEFDLKKAKRSIHPCCLTETLLRSYEQSSAR